MARLNIYDRRERALVRAADALLAPAALRRVFRRSPKRPPARILCLRLERIGDLLMTLPALAQLRASAPAASIDLVVGSWNAAIASTIVGVDRVETANVEWLSRSAAPALSAAGLAGRALAWRARNYDLAINFEPDIRSNLALAAAARCSTSRWTTIFARIRPTTRRRSCARPSAASPWGAARPRCSASLKTPAARRKRVSPPSDPDGRSASM